MQSASNSPKRCPPQVRRMIVAVSLCPVDWCASSPALSMPSFHAFKSSSSGPIEPPSPAMSVVSTRSAAPFLYPVCVDSASVRSLRSPTRSSSLDIIAVDQSSEPKIASPTAQRRTGDRSSHQTRVTAHSAHPHGHRSSRFAPVRLPAGAGGSQRSHKLPRHRHGQRGRSSRSQPPIEDVMAQARALVAVSHSGPQRYQPSSRVHRQAMSPAYRHRDRTSRRSPSHSIRSTPNRYSAHTRDVCDKQLMAVCCYRGPIVAAYRPSPREERLQAALRKLHMHRAAEAAGSGTDSDGEPPIAPHRSSPHDRHPPPLPPVHSGLDSPARHETPPPIPVQYTTPDKGDSRARTGASLAHRRRPSLLDAMRAYEEDDSPQLSDGGDEDVHTVRVSGQDAVAVALTPTGSLSLQVTSSHRNRSRGAVGAGRRR